MARIPAPLLPLPPPADRPPPASTFSVTTSPPPPLSSGVGLRMAAQAAVLAGSGLAPAPSNAPVRAKTQATRMGTSGAPGRESPSSPPLTRSRALALSAAAAWELTAVPATSDHSSDDILKCTQNPTPKPSADN